MFPLGPYLKILCECFCRCVIRALLYQDPLHKRSCSVDACWGRAFPPFLVWGIMELQPVLMRACGEQMSAPAGCFCSGVAISSRSWMQSRALTRPSAAWDLLGAGCPGRAALAPPQGKDTPLSALPQAPAFANCPLLGLSRSAIWGHLCLIQAGCAALPSGLFCTTRW